MKRRDLLRGALATGSLGVLDACGQATPVPPPAVPSQLHADTTKAAPPPPEPEPKREELCRLALDAALAAGASYADIRVADYRTQSMRTREARVISVRDDTSRGFGVRVIAQGTWGFAASSQF